MDRQLIFDFKTDISRINVTGKLNNPFGVSVPEIARIAAKEFQEFIALECKEWADDLLIQNGKMFGILVVQKEDHTYSYLGTFSGKLPKNVESGRFIPSIFDDSVGDFFINKGMVELSEIGRQIRSINNPTEIAHLKKRSRQKSVALQKRLFENYNFLNLSGNVKNLLEIFMRSSHGYPPSAAGECAAPKLLQYAFRHRLKPVAMTEFWWGNQIKRKGREHKVFYPACKERCRPILEYMLEDEELYERACILEKDKSKSTENNV